MNHIQYEEWLYYVKDELDEQTRERYEDHLYVCDACMSLYIAAIEAAEQQVPVLQTELNLTDNIMEKVTEQKKEETIVKTGRVSFFQKTIVHYAIAAAITLLLTSQGVFSQLLTVVSDFEEVNKEETSIISQMMDQSFSIIDKFEKEMKEGESNE